MADDLKIEAIHNSTGYMRITSQTNRADAFLKMWWHRTGLMTALLHSTDAGHLWCRHGENDRNVFIADARNAGLTVDDVPDELSTWSAIPDDEDEDE